jgi:hypothetical protein
MRFKLVVFAFCLFFVGSTAFSATYYIPQVVVGSNSGNSPYSTTFVFFNNNTATSNVTLTLTGNDGSALTVNFPGVATNVSTYSFTLLPGGTRILQTDTSGALVTGAATVTSDLAIGVSGLYTTYDTNGRFISEVGVQGTSAITDSILPVQKSSDGAVNTGIAFYSPTAAQITLSLYNQDGVSAGNATVNLAAGNHTASFLHEFFTGYTSSSFTGTIKVHSTVPVAAVTLRQNSTYKATYTSIPVVATTSTATTINLTHFVDGLFGQDKYVTTFMIFNLSNTGASVQLFPTKDDGTAVTLHFAAGSSDNLISLPAGASRILVTDTTSNASGAVQIVSTNGTPIGVAALYTQYSVNGSTTTFNTEVGIQDSPAYASVTLPVFSKVNFNDANPAANVVVGTAFALYNPDSANPVSLKAVFVDMNGVQSTSAAIQLTPHQHQALYFHEMFPGWGVTQGSLAFQVTSTAGTNAVSALALRSNASPYNMTSFLVTSGTGAQPVQVSTGAARAIYGDVTGNATVNEWASTASIANGVTLTVAGLGTGNVKYHQKQAISEDGRIFTDPQSATGPLYIMPGKYRFRVMGNLSGTIPGGGAIFASTGLSGVYVEYTSDSYLITGTTTINMSVPVPTVRNVAGTIANYTSTFGLGTSSQLVFYGTSATNSQIHFAAFSSTDTTGNGTFNMWVPDGDYKALLTTYKYGTNDAGAKDNTSMTLQNIGTFSITGTNTTLDGVINSTTLTVPALGTLSGAVSFAGGAAPPTGPFTITAADTSLPDLGWTSPLNYYPAGRANTPNYPLALASQENYSYYPRNTMYINNTFGGTYSETLGAGTYRMSYSMLVYNSANTSVGTVYYTPTSNNTVTLTGTGNTYNFPTLSTLPSLVKLSGYLGAYNGGKTANFSVVAISNQIIGTDGNIMPNLRYYASAVTDANSNYNLYVLPGLNYQIFLNQDLYSVIVQ